MRSITRRGCENLALLSIIIPVYNVEKYLSRCIDSVLAQSIKDYEIILVDDGSTDRSGEICDQYARRDGSISVIHKQNGGLASARNAGILTASGKWVAFVDSDDWITPSFVEECSRIVKKYSVCDAISFGYFIDYTESNSTLHRAYKTDKYFPKESLPSAVLEMEEPGMFNSVCNKCYRRELLEAHQVRFAEKMEPGEDLLFNCAYFSVVSSCALSSKELYHYMRQGEATLTKRYDPKLTEKVDVFDSARKQLCSALGENAQLACMRNRYYAKYQVSALYNVYGASVTIPRPQRLELLNRIYSDKRLKESIGDYSDGSVLARIFRGLYCVNSPIFADMVYSILFWLKRHFKKLYIRQRTRLMGSK